MRRLSILLLALTSAATGAWGQEPDSGEVRLEPKVYRKWRFELPAERFSPVEASLDFSVGLGRVFKVEVEGTGLRVDTDGDGETDVRVQGPEGLVVLEGERSRQALRLRNDGIWFHAPASAMEGELDGVRLRIIDQNNNGRYDDFGEDALVVGRGRAASYLSRVVAIDGRLREIAVSADGTVLRHRPYSGEVGGLALGFETRGKVLSAVLKSLDGSRSFEVSSVSGPLELPVGRYLLDCGELGLGEARVKVRTGRSKPIEVVSGKTTELEWGGPLRAEFIHHRRGDEIVLSPLEISYFGKRGEEYLDWSPVGKSPKILVVARRTGREIAEAFFPGSA